MSRKMISFDWAIKKILRSKANFGILEGFLSVLINESVTIIEILESESNKENENDKTNRVDIKVKDSTSKIILIEVQYTREDDYLHRILYGSSKVITEHITEGTAYRDIVKVISVNILFLHWGSGDDYVYHGSTTFVGMHNNSVLELNKEQKKLLEARTVQEIFPEFYVIDVSNFDDVAKDSLDQWVYFLKNEEIEPEFDAPGLQEAKEILDTLKMTPEEKHEYERYLDERRRELSRYRSSYVLGQMDGIELGIEQAIRTMAQNGISAEQIAEMMNRPLNEVNRVLANE